MPLPSRQQQVVGALALDAAQHSTKGNTRSATGTRRLSPDLVVFASTPSGAARLISSTGIGTRTKSRTRISRSSYHRSPVHAATSSTSASCWSRPAAAWWNDSSSSSANGRISVRTPRPFGTRSGSPGSRPPTSREPPSEEGRLGGPASLHQRLRQPGPAERDQRSGDLSFSDGADLQRGQSRRREPGQRRVGDVGLCTTPSARARPATPAAPASSADRLEGRPHQPAPPAHDSTRRSPDAGCRRSGCRPARGPTSPPTPSARGSLADAHDAFCSSHSSTSTSR